MKAHTNNFKTDITKLGKELDAKITYQLNGQTIELGAEQLNSVVPHFESSILKSTMKQLDLDSNVDIPLNTILNAQFGLKVNGAYEYLNYGNYVVYSSEKKEDTDSYSIICYDKMLYSMVDYEDLGITYPITIRNYINTICTHLGLTFKNANDTFANYNREIEKELYLDSNGGSLGYTFRDVLDQLAQATASTICINDDTDELEIRYITDTTLETQEVEGTSISIPNADSGNINSLELKGNTTQETTNGNQLVDFNNLTTSNSTYTFTNDVLTINATGYDHNRVEYDITDVVKNNPGKTLKFGYSSVDFSNFTSDNNTLVQLQIITSSSTFKTLATKSGNSISKTNYAIPSDTSDIRYVYAVFFASASASSNNDSILKLTKPLIYLDNNDTYEPFTNGKSPNPDYPQNIDVVTGEQEILCGSANSFDITKITANKAIVGSTGVIGNSSVSNLSDYTEVIPNTTYILNYEYTTLLNTTNRGYCYYNESKEYISGTNYNPTFKINKFIIPENAKYIRFAYDKNCTNIYFSKVQINEINLGKNLYNATMSETTTRGITRSADTQKIYLNGTIESAGTADFPLSPQLFPAGIYYLNYEIESGTITGTNGFNLYVYSSPNNGRSSVGRTNTIGYKNSLAVTLTAPAQLYIHGYTQTTNVKYENVVIKYQITKVDADYDFAPYKTPIELCKIDTYQDSIKKATGKNLFDGTYTNAVIGGTTGTIFAFASNGRTAIVKVEPNTTYTIKKYQGTGLGNRFTISEYPSIITTGQTEMGANSRLFYNSSETQATITTSSTGNYLYVYVTQDETSIPYLQIEKGTTATTYEPYGIGWYIEKQIGKVVLDGSESYTTLTNPSRFRITQTYNVKNDIAQYCNYYVWGAWGNDNNSIDVRDNGIRINNYLEETTANFKTWLSTHNTIVYYVLANPTYTFIEDTELISQLESVRLLEGLNNIIVSSGDLSSPIKINYISLIDTIDEEYFKDTNVNFGEKYGPVNSIVLSRSESDNVYLQDEQSIAQNGLCEIKISENQIMNWNDRADYLPNILNKLDGLEYYINDFTSTGIMYYDLCDRYFAKIGDIKYKCILFNDEKVIENGLEENIHTDMPEETETDYKKADKTDRKINQTSLIVDKQNQTIEALITETTDGDNPNSLTSRIKQTAKSLSLTVSDNQTSAGLTIKLYNEDGSEIDSQSGNITLSGLVKFTDLSGSGTTTINGANITTGSISADRIGGGTLTINTSGGGYLSAGANTTHVNVSGLNVTGGAGININNLGFNSDGSKFTFASEIDVPTLLATNRVRTNHIQANGSISIHSGGDDGSYAGNGGIYMATGQISGTPSHITLNANPGLGYVYAEGYNTGRGRVATSTSGPSSRCLKTNIEEFKQNEYNDALTLLDEIKLYDYNYKYNIHPKKEQFGFMIDDLLENKLASKFLYFIDEKATINENNNLDYLVEDESKAISFKRYDEETLIKYLLVVCKALQQKINKLEEK